MSNRTRVVRAAPRRSCRRCSTARLRPRSDKYHPHVADSIRQLACSVLLDASRTHAHMQATHASFPFPPATSSTPPPPRKASSPNFCTRKFAKAPTLGFFALLRCCSLRFRSRRTLSTLRRSPLRKAIAESKHAAQSMIEKVDAARKRRHHHHQYHPLCPTPPSALPSTACMQCNANPRWVDRWSRVMNSERVWCARTCVEQ